MELGMIGMGRMGSNMARSLLARGHHVVVYNPVAEAVEAVVSHGDTGATSFAKHFEFCGNRRFGIQDFYP